jgi:biotin carboxyl carrier protein
MGVTCVDAPEGYPVRAALPGTVADVVAAAGDVVESGDPLVLLDSMKMEIPVLAPRGGTVRRVVVGPGDRLQQGDLVAVLDAVQ